jgi:hypothetical protein
MSGEDNLYTDGASTTERMSPCLPVIIRPNSLANDRLTSTYHPQSNGGQEMFHKTQALIEDLRTMSLIKTIGTYEVFFIDKTIGAEKKKERVREKMSL